jgi:hypothetical protein
LLVDLGAEVGIVAAHALHLPVEALAQLTAPGVGQGRQGAHDAVAGDRVGGRQGGVPRLGQGRPGLLGEVGAVQQPLQVPRLAAVVQVDGHWQEFLLLLVADERRLEPEDRLREVQGPDAPQAQLRARRQRQGAADAPLQALRREVQADQEQLGVAAACDGVLQQAIDQGGPVAGQLRAGVLRDRLRVEGDAHHLRLRGGPALGLAASGQHQVVDLRLHLVPHPPDDFGVVAQESL